MLTELQDEWYRVTAKWPELENVSTMELQAGLYSLVFTSQELTFLLELLGKLSGNLSEAQRAARRNHPSAKVLNFPSPFSYKPEGNQRPS